MEDEMINDDELEAKVPLDEELDLKEKAPLLDDEAESIDDELEKEEAGLDEEESFDDLNLQ